MRTAASRAGALLAEGPALLLSIPLWIWWACWKGAFPATVWIPGLAYLAVVAVMLAVAVPRPPLSGARAVALAGLLALAAWSSASLLWADEGGFAWEGAGRAWLAVAAFALPALWPPARRALLVATAALPLAAACGALSALVAALADASSLSEGRLEDPAGYANASGALFVMGALPALVLAARRERAPALRVALLALAGVLAGAALLTQSRGAVAAAVAGIAVAFAAGPGRTRLLVPSGLLAAGVLAVAPALLDVRRAALHGRAAGALDDAALALGLLGLGLAIAGACYVAVDRRAELSARASRAASRTVAVVCVMGLVAGAATFVAVEGSPVGWAKDRWHSFTHADYNALDRASTRFTGDLGSNRYDYWRVSVDLFAAHPLLGTGAENFAAPYLQRRHTRKAPLYAHSAWFGTLAGLGLPGILALLAFVGAAIAGVARAARASPAPERALVIAAALPFVALTVHGSADWLAPFGALVAPAVGLVAAACGPATEDRLGAERPAGRRAGSAALACALAAAALATLPVYVSTLLGETAAANARRDPARSLADLRTAQDWNPLAGGLAIDEGLVALDARRPLEARAAFARASRRDPSSWFARLELGLLDARAGRRAAAIRELDEAIARNPREPIARRVRREVAAGKRPDPRAVAHEVLAAPA
ncbi:MAG: O-antigen ligase family protein [Solirubrobacteraceae bacterium]